MTKTTELTGFEPVEWVWVDFNGKRPLHLRATKTYYSAATVEQLVQERDQYKINCALEVDDHRLTKTELAASQAREQQLREVLVFIASYPRIGSYEVVQREKASEALALPQDDTALRQWGAKLLREMADHAEAHIDYPLDQEDIDLNKSLCFHVEHLRRKADELEKR